MNLISNPKLFRPSHLPYRKTARIVVVNPERLILIGEAKGYEGIWKLPGGGLEEGETHRQAAYRELWEETGLRQVKLQKQFAGPYTCHYPLSSRAHPEFRGQKSRWFLAPIDVPEPEVAPSREFKSLRWATAAEVIALSHNDRSGTLLTQQNQDISRKALIKFGLLPALLLAEIVDLPPAPGQSRDLSL